MDGCKRHAEQHRAEEKQQRRIEKAGAEPPFVHTHEGSQSSDQCDEWREMRSGVSPREGQRREQDRCREKQGNPCVRRREGVPDKRSADEDCDESRADDGRRDTSDGARNRPEYRKRESFVEPESAAWTNRRHRGPP